jgi:hypothetical protein
MAVLSGQLIHELKDHQRLVTELAELRHVRYGMLNADKWVRQVSEIIEQRIQEIELDGEKRASAKAALERLLETLLTEADRYLREQHTSGNWWQRSTGRMKEGLRNTLMDIDTVKAGIPAYADQILDQLENPETRKDISAFLNGLINDVTESTFGQMDDSVRDRIRERNRCTGSITECKAQIANQMGVDDAKARQHALLLVLCSVLMLLIAVRDRDSGNQAKWLLLCGGALALLLCGIFTPMLEVEAQISELHIVLMGHSLAFYNEVLYFQSKSIFDVASILVSKREITMVLVGILLVMFSVVFPALKLAASVALVYRPDGLGRSKLVRFFALKSAKWSMADVMVIAILMAYVGFNGMISRQLEKIASGAATAGVDVLTTNGTALQPGYFMFLAFCLFGLLLSTLLDAELADKGAGYIYSA